MTATTRTGWATSADTFTPADLKRLKREIAAMPQPQWTIVSPDGRVWQDADPKALLRVLARAAWETTLFADIVPAPDAASKGKRE